MPPEGTVIAIVAGGAFFLLDQWSKKLILTRLSEHCISWGPVLRIRRVKHCKDIYRRCCARALFVTMWLVALFCAIFLHRSGGWFHNYAALLGLGLALGGAAGNLRDILRWQYVVDFIDLRWWPVFNLADVGIVAGLAVAFWARA